jgi:hypothetical protein
MRYLTYSFVFFIVGLMFVFFLTSCEKVINVDLNAAPPKIVIEGRVTNQPSEIAKVTITKSLVVSSTNSYPTISGASVKVTSSAGIVFSFTETAPGVYTNSALIGSPGTAYTLTVVAEGTTYTATSIMPQPVLIDSIYQESVIGKKIVTLQYTDPLGFGNNYQFIETINGKRNENIFIADDSFLDGGLVESQFLNEQSQYDLKTGDNVLVELQCIDKNILRYLRGLQDIQLNNTVPANPPSNLTNKALGYFSAYTTDKRSIVIR